MKCQFATCRKKLSLVDQRLVCRCGKKLCTRHRFFADHTCDAKITPSDAPSPRSLKSSSAFYDSSNMAF